MILLWRIFFSVYASDTAGTTYVSSSDIITIQKPAVPLKVSCPFVAEPAIPYRCGFATIPGTGSLDINYEEQTVVNTVDTFTPFKSSSINRRFNSTFWHSELLSSGK